LLCTLRYASIKKELNLRLKGSDVLQAVRMISWTQEQDRASKMKDKKATTQESDVAAEVSHSTALHKRKQVMAEVDSSSSSEEEPEPVQRKKKKSKHLRDS
jgi:hypothetical protein